MPSPLRTSQQRRIVAQYVSGTPTSDIQKNFGVSSTAVANALQKQVLWAQHLASLSETHLVRMFHAMVDSVTRDIDAKKPDIRHQARQQALGIVSAIDSVALAQQSAVAASEAQQSASGGIYIEDLISRIDSKLEDQQELLPSPTQDPEPTENG